MADDPADAAGETAGGAGNAAGGAGNAAETVEASGEAADREAASAAARLATALDECQARQLRTLADFDNYRRRTARDLDHARSSERDRLVAEWIPVIDDLDRALSHAGADPATLVDGVRGVREAAVAVLRRAGVSRVDEAAGPFDPTQHEVGAVVADPQTPAGDVVDVLRPGYETEDGRVLRPTAVAVSGGQGNGDQQRQ